MKISKMIKSLVVFSVLFLCMPLTNIGAKEREFSPNDNVSTFELNLNDLQVGDEIVIYENKDTDERLVIDVIESVPAISTYGGLLVNNGSWGVGSPPAGSHTLYPHYSKGVTEIGFYLDISCYPVVFHRTYNPVLLVVGLNVSNIKTQIIRNKPGSFPAAASMTWKADASLSGTHVGTVQAFLQFEMNSKGNAKLSYRM